jgi:hypothetical protein
MKRHLIEFGLALIIAGLLMIAKSVLNFEIITICTLAIIASKVMLMEVKEIQEKNKKKD